MSNSIEPVEYNEDIKDKIYTIRGLQVMLDSDLAQLYEVKTKVFNQSVKRNIERFPENFRFQLLKEEYDNLRSQSVTLSSTNQCSGYSYERAEWGHGAFTKSFLDGLGKMRADYDKDGAVTIKEIDLYITNSVKKLTNGKQKPTTIIPNSVPDFAIGVR